MPQGYCQYCEEGPFENEFQKKLHEQSYCEQRPATPEKPTVSVPSVETNGLSGHPLDDDRKKEWEEEQGKVTRLQFFKVDPNLIVPGRVQRKLDRVIEQRKRRPQSIWLKGGAGVGKTSLALQFAAQTHSPTYKAPCPAMTEVSQWMGRTAYTPDRGTYYVPSVFVEACETENSVIILNDVTRVENPKVLNPLMDVTDDTGATWSEEMGREVRVAPGVVFIATSNEGWEYVGTDDADVALKDRFAVINIPVPPVSVLDQIISSKIGETEEIRAGTQFFIRCMERGLPLTVRHALRLTEDIKYGASLMDAAMLTMIGDLSDEHQTEALQLLQADQSRHGVTLDSLAVDDEWSRWGE